MRTHAAKQFDEERASSFARGYDKRWAKARETFLRQHPLCACPDCQEGKIRTIPATVVDHIIAHRGDKGLFWDESNWQPMSKQCHDKKTFAEVKGRASEDKPEGALW